MASSRAAWWKARLRFLRRAFVKGLEPHVRLFSALSVLAGVSAIGVVGYALDRPRLGSEIALGLVALILLEGAFRLARDAESERDEARRLATRSQAELPFPDVLLKAGPPLVIETRDSASFVRERETLITVRMSVTNREMARRAILRFSAFADRPELRPGVTRLSRADAREFPPPAFLPDPVKLEPLDYVEGEVLFVWDHSMDFVWGKDLSEEDVIDRLMPALHINAKDEVSTVKVEVPLPEGQWYRAGKESA
jgi:hypothetical protein